MAYARRSLLWLLGAAIVTPFAWSTAASLLRILLVPMPDDSFRLFVGGALFGSVWGAVVTAVFAVPYGLLLGAWPWLVRAVPSFERSRVRLAGALAVLALPAALYVGLETGRFAGAIRPREFTEAFLAAFVAGWVGLLTPRLVLKSLAPGNLIAKSVQAAV